MKTTFRFIIAAMAAIAVLSSCQKELANETANKTADGVRTISVQFDNSTKASLSGVTPTFANNDKIRVSNDDKSEECTITVSGTTTTFTTTLSGALIAIYPAEAAVLDSEEADAPIASSNNFKVLATQDGTVEKAIIASATVEEGESTATFYGLTSLFVVTPPSEATYFTITSLNKIGTNGQRATTPNAEFINTSGANDAAKRIITVTGLHFGGNAYVSLVPGVNLTDLSFEYTTDDTHGAMKGIPMKDITAANKTNATAANTKYTINNSNWHPYVIINGLKWAKTNIGADTETDAGTYFSWGGTEGYVRSGSNWVKADATPESVLTNGFALTNYPHYSGSSYTKYTSTDGKTILDLADDAANANWGGSWRMPTQSEFDALAALSSTWGGTPVGRTFGPSSNQIFLRAAGYGEGTGLTSYDYAGCYWSSSLCTVGDAYYLLLIEDDDEKAFTDNNWRYDGKSVRALSE